MQIPDLGNKLSLITQMEFMGLKLYNDKLCDPAKVNSQMIYKLWLHCCRKSSAVTIEQMKKFAPYAAHKLDVLDRFVDAEGKTTLNPEEYKTFRLKLAEQKKNENKAKSAAKAAKKNFWRLLSSLF